MWGYEIKVSRRDFLADDKWPQYLGLCNQFWFVTPPDLIKPEELGNHVGLLAVAKTGNMLRTIRKAAHREIAPPVLLYQYLLMCRCQFTRDWSDSNNQDTKADFWRRWLADKNATLDVGHEVSRRLSEMIQKQIHEVECENKRLASENKNLEPVAQVLKDLGIWMGRWNLRDEVEAQVKRARALVPEETLQGLRNTRESIDKLLKQFTESQDGTDKDGL